MSGRKSILTGIAAVAIALVVYFLVDSSESDLAGDTGDAIAERIGEDCSTKRELVESDFSWPEPRLGDAADEVARITCEEGEVSPISLVYLFPNPDALRAAVGDPPMLKDSHCIIDADAFSLNFDGARELCRRLGGKLTASAEQRKRSEVLVTAERVFAANCGNTSYLLFKGADWSSGCTGGSANVGKVRWLRWTRAEAFGTGTARLRGPCVTRNDPGRSCKGQNALYLAEASVTLTDPRSCKGAGYTANYFSKAAYTVTLRPGNPFGRPPGRDTTVYPAVDGVCTFATE